MSTNPIRPNVSNPTVALAPGTPAPDFRLPSTPDRFVTLSEFRGRPVILAFYPADWSPVCGDRMARSSGGACANSGAERHQPAGGGLPAG